MNGIDSIVFLAIPNPCGRPLTTLVDYPRPVPHHAWTVATFDNLQHATPEELQVAFFEAGKPSVQLGDGSLTQNPNGTLIVSSILTARFVQRPICATFVWVLHCPASR